MTRRSPIAIASFMLVALLGGCGGGGDDDGASFSLSASTVSFSARSDEVTPPTPQTVTATATNGNVYLAVTYDGGPASPIANATLSTSLLSANAIINIVPKSGRELGAGTYTGTVTVRGCGDSDCRSEGSSKSIRVTYTVSEAPPGITLGATTIELSAVRGQPEFPSENLMVTSPAGATVEYTTSVTYLPVGAEDWLVVPASATATNTLPIAVNSTAVSGNHMARLTLTPVNTALPQTVIVRYNLRQPTLSFAPASLEFNITSASPASALQQVVSVTSTGGATLNWTARTTQPWLNVSPTSGTIGDSVTVSLRPARLEELAPGDYSGFVSFDFTGAHISTAQLPVQFTYRLPKVSLAMPYVAIAGSTEPVILRGEGFDHLTTERILFGATAATAITRISDTELRVTPPALPAGRYTVAVEKQSNVTRTLADLVVVDPVAYTYAAQASAGEKSRIIYDAERRSVYVCNRTSGRVERYAFNAGAWTRSTSEVMGGLRTMALAPDGSEITAVSGGILSLDPSSLTATFRPGSPFFTGVLAEQMEYGNHGWATITGSAGTGVSNGAAAYDFRSHHVLSASYGRPYFSGRIASALDGSRKIFAHQGAPTPQPVSYEDISAGVYVTTDVMRDVESVVADRTGDRVVLVGTGATEVFDRDFSLLGNLPVTTLAVALTPNGERAYTYDSGGSVRAFDLTASLGSSSSLYPEIGTATAPADAPGTGIVMTLSLDSNTLFIAGNQRVLVMPVP